MGSWPPCTYCRAAIGVGDPPPPPPLNSTMHGSIEATEPRSLPDEQQRRREVHKMLADQIACDSHETALPPLAALAADAAERREPIESVIEELEFQREAIRELSRRISELTQAVLGTRHG